jgi:hypothetical protein
MIGYATKDSLNSPPADARMNQLSDGQPITPERLVNQLLEFTESSCIGAYSDFEERLELESVEYGISEETLTDIFLNRSDEDRERMLAWFIATNLAVGGVYFLGRFNREFVRLALQHLRSMALERFGDKLGPDANQPFDTVRKLLRELGFDAYQAGMVTFLSLIGYLDHEDATKATLDTEFLNGFRMDFTKSIPYLHQAELSLGRS